MSYTKEEIQKGMFNWAKEAYDNPEDFEETENYETSDEYAESCVQTLFQYIEENK